MSRYSLRLLLGNQELFDDFPPRNEGFDPHGKWCLFTNNPIATNKVAENAIKTSRSLQINIKHTKKETIQESRQKSQESR